MPARLLSADHAAQTRSGSPCLSLSASLLGAGGQVVLRDVSVTISAGEIVGVVGPNGAGKSTLLRALAGLPCGRDATRDLSPEIGGRGVALVGHDAALHPQLTLAENLALAVSLAPGRRRSVSDALLRVGLRAAADRPASACSAGMLRRAGLARAWACRPGLLLLDEPTADLDDTARGLPGDLAHEVRGSGGMVVVATHEPSVFEDLADRWLHVGSGRVGAVQS